MKPGSFIEIKYTGKLENGDVFDSTDPSVVEGAFGSAVIVLGAGHVIKGLETALQDMKPDETRDVSILPEEGFGKREAKKLKLYPMRIFSKDKITPYPGLRVTIEGKMATVKTISPGRIVVDFNHPLAGLKLNYHVKLIKEVTSSKEQIAGLLKFHLGSEKKFSIKDGKLTLEDIPEYAQDKIREEIEAYTSFKNPRFVILAGENNEKHNQGSGKAVKKRGKK